MRASKGKFCFLCGALLALENVAGRQRPRCNECGYVQYLNPGSASAGVVVDSDRQLLLIQRKIRPFQGDWALPAGYQEVDESPQETAIREIGEETGIEVEVERLLDLVWVPDDPRKPANVAVFLCRPIGGTLCAGDDALDARWFALNDLPHNLGFNNLNILKKHFEKDLS